MKLAARLGAFVLAMVAGTGISAAPPKFRGMPTVEELNAAVEALVSESEKTLRRDARGRVTHVQLFGAPMEVRYVGDFVEAIRVGSSWLSVREDRLGNERTGRLVYLGSAGELLGSERLRADELGEPDGPRFLPWTEEERERAAEHGANEKSKWARDGRLRPREYDQVCIWQCDFAFERDLNQCDRDADFERLLCDALPSSVRYVCAAHAIESRSHCRDRASSRRYSCYTNCGR